MARDTRDRLVSAARELFWKQGYHPTGIAQILREARCLSGSLYYFFPTKEDLLRAVLEQYRAMLEPRVLAPVFQRVSDPIERVFGILDGYRRQLAATKFLHGCPIGSLALEVGHTHPEARKLIAANFDAWRAAVEASFRGAAGRLPPDTDPRALAEFVLVTMEGAVMLARIHRSLRPFDAAVSVLRDHVDRLIAEGTQWMRRKKPARAKGETG
jgi:TetR/AcrR family transcriptional repressor of nem operon